MLKQCRHSSAQNFLPGIGSIHSLLDTLNGGRDIVSWLHMYVKHTNIEAVPFQFP